MTFDSITVVTKNYYIKLLNSDMIHSRKLQHVKKRSVNNYRYRTLTLIFVVPSLIAGLDPKLLVQTIFSLAIYFTVWHKLEKSNCIFLWTLLSNLGCIIYKAHGNR